MKIELYVLSEIASIFVHEHVYATLTYPFINKFNLCMFRQGKGEMMTYFLEDKLVNLQRSGDTSIQNCFSCISGLSRSH